MNVRSLLNKEDKSPQVPHRKLDKPNPATSRTSSSTTGTSSTHRKQLNEQDNRIPIFPPRPHANVVVVVPNQTATIHQFQDISSSTKSSRKGEVVGRSARDEIIRRPPPGGQVIPIGLHTFMASRTPKISNGFLVKTPDTYFKKPQPKSRSSKNTTSKSSRSSTMHEEVARSPTKIVKKKTGESTNDILMINSIITMYCQVAETGLTDRYYRVKVVRGLKSALILSGVDSFEQLHTKISRSELRDFMNYLEERPTRDTIAKIRGVFEGSKEKIVNKNDPRNREGYVNKINHVLNALLCLEEMHGYSQKSDCKR